MNNRKLYIDVLKIISAIFVIAIHLSSIKWYVIDVGSFDWQSLNILNSFTRVCVPLFVMSSGVLLLDQNRKIDFQIIFKKYISRIVFIYVVWSMLYALFSLLVNPIEYGFIEIIKQFIYRSIKGPVHFWYLFTLVGLYLITPFIREFTKDKKLIEYFLVIGFVFIFIRSLRDVILIDTIELYIDYLNFHFTLGYTTYFVLGYYLVTYPISKKMRIIIYCLSIASIIFTIVMTSKYSLELNHAYEDFYGYLRASTMIKAMGIFVFMQSILSHKNLSDNYNRALMKLTSLNFGVYLIHLMLVFIVGKFELLDLNIPLFISVILYTFLIYILSLIIAWFISKNKYLAKMI